MTSFSVANLTETYSIEFTSNDSDAVAFAAVEEYSPFENQEFERKIVTVERPEAAVYIIFDFVRATMTGTYKYYIQVTTLAHSNSFVCTKCKILAGKWISYKDLAENRLFPGFKNSANLATSYKFFASCCKSFL